MAKGYRPVDRDQVFLFPPDMREWLPEDYPVWLVIRAVEEHLDTSSFHAGRRTGGAGAAGYDPDMLVTVLVWAYAHKVTSSREIERLCGTDVAFRVICAGNQPDHVTFARFRGAFPDATGEFFAQVLVLCARLGMGKLGTVALDGMKIAGNASKAASRTGEALARLAAETVAAHAAADAAEDELFGEGRRGDEVPGEAWRPRAGDSGTAGALASLKADREAAAAAEEARARAYRDRRAAGRRAGGSPGAGGGGGGGGEPGPGPGGPGLRAGGTPGAVRGRAAPPRPRRRGRGPLPGPAGKGQGRGRESPGRGGGPQGRRTGSEPQRARPGPQHHRPGLPADAGPRRRVPAGIQHPEHDQRRRADHRHRAHR